MPAHPTSLARLTSKLILTAPSNGDEYTCVATAGLKRTTSTTTVYNENDEDEELLDIQKLLFKPAKPIITSFFNEVFQDMGTDIVLPCRVYSLTKSQALWQDPNDEVIYGDSGRIRVLPSGDLLITNLRWSDMGTYTCTAKNMYGKESVYTFLYPTKPLQ
ncbi:neural/ectodermal development factor IMP-L2-like [Manduca sexta]|nr:neural/ectodermal development factor IMP-L2-like [Manduca sexta]